jgi:hypothetical protein
MAPVRQCGLRPSYMHRTAGARGAGQSLRAPLSALGLVQLSTQVSPVRLSCCEVQEAQTDLELAPAGDVYTFGVLLWEIYHGCKCFRTTHAGFDIRKGTFPRFPIEAPLPYAALAAACLLPDPQARCVLLRKGTDCRSARPCLCQFELTMSDTLLTVVEAECSPSTHTKWVQQTPETLLLTLKS